MPELGQLLSLEYGAALPAERRSGHGFPVFGSNGEVGRHDQPLVDGPGIVIGRKGSVGKVCWSEDPFWPIDTTYWVKCAAEQRRWIYWLLSRLPLAELDSSTGVPGLNRNDVYELSVFEPPTADEKSQIAAVLDTIDTTIRQTETIIEKLKQVKQGLLHDLLTRGIDANGELRPPQSEAPHLVDQRRPVVYGILMPGQGHEGGVPVVKVKDIVGGRILLDQLLLTSPAIDQEYKRSRLAPGDLLFTIRGSVGRTAFVPGQLEGANITQDTARVGITGVDARFVREYLAMPSPVRFIATHTLGVAVQGINLRDVRRIPIAVPRADEAKAIADMLDAASDRIATEALEAQKLTIAKSGLMDDLLTGRVRVTPLLEAAHA